MQLSNVIQPEMNSAEVSSLDFRKIMNAMAYPGRAVRCPSAAEAANVPTVTRSSQQIAKSLVSRDVTVSFFKQVPTEACLDWVRFTLRSQRVEPEHGDFLFVNAEDLTELDLETLPLGTAESPERSVTLLINVSHDFSNPAERPLVFSGPGVNPNGPAVVVNLDSVPLSFFERRRLLAPIFPLGLDAYFCSDKEFIALPRTTQVTW
jgi:phosphonate C-P lyase system protein PhnH